jgi:hypothetical protein
MQRSIIATPCKRCSLWAEKSRRRKVRMWPTPTCALHKSGSASWGIGRVAHVIGTAVRDPEPTSRFHSALMFASRMARPYSSYFMRR